MQDAHSSLQLAPRLPGVAAAASVLPPAARSGPAVAVAPSAALLLPPLCSSCWNANCRQGVMILSALNEKGWVSCTSQIVFISFRLAFSMKGRSGD